jgi:diaminopimelate decarboxylase
MLRGLTTCHRTLPNCFSYSVYFLKGTDGRLLNHKQQNEIAEFVERQPMSSSFLVYNSTEANRKLTAWQTALPWIRPFYAIKSNPIGCLLKELTAGGSGLDCASRAEIKQALDLGLPVSDIVYSNPIKDENDLKWAADNNIQLTTADTTEELEKIKQLAPNMKVLWRIAIKEDSADNLSTPFSGKFGDDIDNESKIHTRMKQIKNLGVKLEGIHFHCGSGQHGSSAFGRAVHLARKCLEIGRYYGHNMETLDVGGGFPSGNLSQKTIEALSITRNDPLGYRIMAEPGRHFSAYSFYLLTRVLGKRVKSGKTCYHLNESLYHSFNSNIMDGMSFEMQDQFYGRINSGKQEPLDAMETSSLFGMTCDGLDVITKSLNVPKDMKVKDWLCFSGMGAYTYGPRSTFNGMNSTEKIQYWSGNVEPEATAVPSH